MHEKGRGFSPSLFFYLIALSCFKIFQKLLRHQIFPVLHQSIQPMQGIDRVSCFPSTVQTVRIIGLPIPLRLSDILSHCKDFSCCFLLLCKGYRFPVRLSPRLLPPAMQGGDCREARQNRGENPLMACRPVNLSPLLLPLQRKVKV